ncbi:hypothetical protein FKW77_002942 [Venturia effusa]|uniref:Uncharacterized protein n=1 Tax=Venturia effusa TaxID=50376 RepID=A0A517L6Y4_9PEZI|nr:hypothetical protein FKW77_002942 [Venturia effusa]
MAKPEKAAKLTKPGAEPKSSSTTKASKTKRKPPPAKVQLSSEFVKDSSDEDVDSPAPSVQAKEVAVKKKEPALVNKAPEKKVQSKAAEVEVSSEADTSSDESDESESETSKSDENITKAVPKSSSPSVSASETEKEEEDSSDDDSDSSSGVSITAPTNKGKGPAADTRPRPAATPTSHVSETRPAPDFQPPHGFKSADPSSSSSRTANLFPLQTTAEKQVWHITAPANVPISSLKELAMDELVEGAPVITYKDVEYSFTMDDTARATTSILLSSENGFEPQPIEVQKVVHLRQVIKLPTAPQSEAGIPSSAATTLPQQPQFTVQKRTKREQPKGLKMRYRPSGAGTGDLGHIGSSDDEVSASRRPKSSSTGANVGKKRKERDDDVASGEKEKKKKRKEKRRSGNEDAVALNGTPKKSKDSVPSSSSINVPAKSNGVETPNRKDKEKKKKKKRDKEKA